MALCWIARPQYTCLLPFPRRDIIEFLPDLKIVFYLEVKYHVHIRHLAETNGAMLGRDVTLHILRFLIFNVTETWEQWDWHLLIWKKEEAWHVCAQR